MDKEQFDHIDHFFRQAAEHVSPPANEEAWRKMEALLDNEFNKKRRRGIIWWWPLILVGLSICAGIYYFRGNEKNIELPSSLNNPAPGISTRVPDKHVNGSDAPLSNPQANANLPGVAVNDLLAGASNNARKIAGDQPDTDKEKNVVNLNIKVKKGGIKSPGNQPVRVYTPRNSRFPATASGSSAVTIAEPKSDVKQKGMLDHYVPDFGIVNLSPGTSGVRVSKIFDTPPALPLTGAGVLPELKRKSLSQNRNRSLYFLASGAYDASAAGKIELENFNLKYGIGIGYHLSKRISVQTGFYAGKKSYTAGDGDYTVKPDSYISKILTINADCFFYDVPLSLRYDVVHRKNYNLYAVTGLSSYWSKRETYDYHFLNRNGMYRRMASTFRNNTDFVSVLNVSAGFEYGVSKSIYLQAEPYINVPVAGLGEGNVKLYSAGLQMGIKYQPLKNSKKK